MEFEIDFLPFVLAGRDDEGAEAGAAGAAEAEADGSAGALGGDAGLQLGDTA